MVVYILCVGGLIYILDISPASGNKYVLVGLAVAATVVMEDLECAVVAQASFWRLGGWSS
jgi:hypothetical protein